MGVFLTPEFETKMRRLTGGIYRGMKLKLPELNEERNCLVYGYVIETDDKREAFFKKYPWILFLLSRFWFYWYKYLRRDKAIIASERKFPIPKFPKE